MSYPCLFCGREGIPLSKEHVIPDWLLKFLDLPPDDKMFHAVADAQTGKISNSRTHSSFNFVDGRVCKASCNEGWMHRLEDAAIPILKPLMDGVRLVSSLTLTDSGIVAKWAAKTAYLHSWVGLLDKPVERAHLESLNTDLGTVLPHVAVVAGQAEHIRPSSYYQTDRWPQRSLMPRENETPSQAYKIALQFRRLYLLIAYWPDPTIRYYVTPYQVPLWPQSPQAFAPWLGTLSPRLNIDPTARFADELGILDQPRVIIPNFHGQP